MSHVVKLSNVSLAKKADDKAIQKLTAEIRQLREDLKRELEYLNKNKKDN